MRPKPPYRVSGSIAAGVLYALFRVVEIDELKGPETAIEWARGAVEDSEFLQAFADKVDQEIAAGKIILVGPPDRAA